MLHLNVLINIFAQMEHSQPSPYHTECETNQIAPLHLIYGDRKMSYYSVIYLECTIEVSRESGSEKSFCNTYRVVVFVTLGIAFGHKIYMTFDSMHDKNMLHPSFGVVRFHSFGMFRTTAPHSSDFIR